MNKDLMDGLREASAIVGAGASPYSKVPQHSNEELAAISLNAALAQSSLKRDDIDGLIVSSGWPTGINYDRVAEALGLEVDFVYESWSHGRFTNPSLHLAAMAVKTGMANVVACISVTGSAKRGRPGGETHVSEEYRAAGGPHGEAPHYGLTAPMSGAAMSMQKYLNRYGGTPEKMATIPLTQRRHAALNPRAVLRTPLILEDYLAADYVMTPLRRYDCSIVTDGAVTVLVTSADRAEDLTSTPVYMSGMQSMHAGKNNHSFALPGLGIFQQDEYDFKATPTSLEMVGLTHDDLDAVQIYDAFSPQTLATLERFGFCKPGEALDWVQGGRIDLGGAMPLNTAGGHLSEAHVGGWGHIVELVEQLRGESGERQVANAKVMMYAHSLGDATVFANERLVTT